MAAVLAFLLGAYVADCFEMSAPDEAMKCCASMACGSHGHDQAQDCCKTMASLHKDFVQPSANSPSCSPVFIALLPIDTAVGALGFSFIRLAENFHAPPIPPTLSTTPLRI